MNPGKREPVLTRLGEPAVSKATDAIGDQYRDASNLNRRIALHADYSTNRYGWQRWVFDQLSFGEDCRILELGCGPGLLWKGNRDRIAPGWDIVLSDLFPGMVEEAQRNLGDIGNTITFAVVDAQAIPFPDYHFDAVIANHMLFHVPDKPQAFSEIRRVLKIGGTLYATTNGSDHLQELYELRERFGLGVGPTSHLSPESFTLENGFEQLVPWFSNISVDRYEDALCVTEVEPLIAYIRSGLGSSPEVDDKLSKMTQFIAECLSQNSSVFIRKSAGMFTCQL